MAFTNLRTEATESFLRQLKDLAEDDAAKAALAIAALSRSLLIKKQMVEEPGLEAFRTNKMDAT